jgi:hypothetical protein
MKQNIIILLIFNFVALNCVAQKVSFNWCFGDSSGIDFNNFSNINPFYAGLRTRGSCVSISDTSGALLYYAFTRATLPGNTTRVFNKNDQLLQNGDSIVGGGWYHEIVIIPKPMNDSIYYVFSTGVTSSFGLYYSVLNINANNGLGEMLQKNIQIMPDQQADCISAVKHGNGRDWWIVGRRLNFSVGQWNSEYYTCLITKDSIYNANFQVIGSLNTSAFSKITFSPNGDTLLFTNANDVIEYFQFDRCTGLLSNPVTIRPPATTYSEWTWSNEFSSYGRFIYTSTSKDTTQLFQYDLQSPNPLATRQVLYQSTFPQYAGGDVKRGPDGKIYFSIAYVNTGVSYPYPDSVYNIYNMNLSVINSPDSLGVTCDFQPYSLYLDGKRTYYGLPNNPDYNLGPKIGSPCDTITTLSEPAQQLLIKNVYPNPVSKFLTINYMLPQGKTGTAEIFNFLGEEVYEAILTRYTYTQQIDLGSFESGIYVLKIISANQFTTIKFIKQ